MERDFLHIQRNINSFKLRLLIVALGACVCELPHPPLPLWAQKSGIKCERIMLHYRRTIKLKVFSRFAPLPLLRVNMPPPLTLVVLPISTQLIAAFNQLFL